MKSIIGIIIACLAGGALHAQRVIEVDICVYGGTSAGVVAAYTARLAGKTAVLIEPGRRLGGLTSGGLGYTDIGNKYAITGISRDFYRRVGKHYGKLEQWIFEPGVAEAIFRDYVARGGFEVIYDTRLRDVRKSGTTIAEAQFENSINPLATRTLVKARIFIDATYEGDLMAKAGVSYATGREDNKIYGETINGVQLMEGHQFPDGIDPYKTPGKPKSGLLWGISTDRLQPNGSGDKKIQAYNYRICLTSDTSNQVPITKPDGYDPSRYALLLRLFERFPEKRKLNDWFIWSHMPNRKTDINNRGPFSTDMIGMNYDYPEGSYEVREKIIRDHTNYTKGLLYFFGHDERVPVQLRDEISRWGYPKDEYTDNGHWTPQLYIREARRMIGSYVMTQHNCQGREVVKDGVGMAAYTMDSHNTQRLVVDAHVKNEGNVEVGGFGPYPISYRALVPKPGECTNLLVPVCLSSSHIAFGSIRMEPVFMVLAQSSALAAVMAIDANTSVQAIDVAALQARLAEDPLADGSVFEIMVDNHDTANVKMKGQWQYQRSGGYGPDFLVHTGRDGMAWVKFGLPVSKPGKYKAFVYFPSVEDGAEETMVIVNDGERNTGMTIRAEDVLVEGQTSGEWVPLGTYYFSSGKGFVQIGTRDASGKVVADAVILVPDDEP